MPFAEDVRQLTFPSLYNFRLTSGKEVKEHKFLPTQVQQNAMDDLVDAMDLSNAGPLGADRRPTSWFKCSDSFSPAIHNVFNAVVHRISNPEGDLPPVHPALTKYLDPPARVLEKLKSVGPVAKEAFDVTKGKQGTDDAYTLITLTETQYPTCQCHQSRPSKTKRRSILMSRHTTLTRVRCSAAERHNPRVYTCLMQSCK